MPNEPFYQSATQHSLGRKPSTMACRKFGTGPSIPSVTNQWESNDPTRLYEVGKQVMSPDCFYLYPVVTYVNP